MSEKKNLRLTPAQVIRKRRTDLLIGQSYLSLITKCLCLVLVLYIMLSHVFLLTIAKGNAMFPAIKDGDVVFAYRIPDKYSKDDVIVYRHEGEIRIGRIIGRQTDVIAIDDSGSYRVNGTTQGGEIMYPTYAKEGLEYPFVTPDESFFIMGDYRTQSEDSRDFGPIAEDAVLGKVITILRRRGI